jgi:putative MATE family efflux protein
MPMTDLTKGSIAGHIVSLAVPIFASTMTFMLWLLVDMYFVAVIGKAAVAGVGAAGNVSFLTSALTLVLSAGTMALVAQAVGRKDQPGAVLVFNQSLGLAVICGALAWVGGLMLAPSYMRSVAADDMIVEAGTTYLFWVMPALACQYVTAVIASALRGTGVVRPTVIIQVLAVLANIGLAPLLIGGWGGIQGLGVAGAGLATSLAAVMNLVMLCAYFRRSARNISVDYKQLHPRIEQWRRILSIGLPAGAELAFTFVYVAAIYYALSSFGPAAQAAFGIGSRVFGAIQVPAMAIGLAVGPIAGQNLGAANGDRIKETFKSAALMGSALMAAITIFVQWRPELLLWPFSDDPSTVAIGEVFLRLISLNLVAQGLILVCSGMFQGLGNTVPVLISSGVRLITYATPVMWLSAQPYFRLEHIWYLSIATTTLQAILCLVLLRLELATRFGKSRPPGHSLR